MTGIQFYEILFLGIFSVPIVTAFTIMMKGKRQKLEKVE